VITGLSNKERATHMRPDASKKLAASAPKRSMSKALIGSIIAGIAIAGVVVAVLVGNSNSNKAGDGGPAGSALPAGVVGGQGGGILVSAATVKSTAPTLEVYADFQCDQCGQFEKVFGAMLASMSQAGDVKLVFHTMSFVDTNLKNDSSARSANAAACASDAGKFLEYHSAVFAGQPEKEGTGYTDAQLTEFANTAGITGEPLTTWQTCTSSSQHAQYVKDVQITAEKAGVFDTPTVKLNGENITADLSTRDALAALIKGAKS
jgi:protein-disulfide isomerase